MGDNSVIILKGDHSVRILRGDNFLRIDKFIENCTISIIQKKYQVKCCSYSRSLISTLKWKH
jgi:hypothetical protein